MQFMVDWLWLCLALSRYRWSPAPSGPAGPTSALQAVRPDHVKLRQVVRPASIGPPNETAV